jgi:hypothetical protein
VSAGRTVRLDLDLDVPSRRDGKYSSPSLLGVGSEFSSARHTTVRNVVGLSVACLATLTLVFVSISVFIVQTWGVPFSGMWCCVGLLQNDVSEERVASIFKVEEVM